MLIYISHHIASDHKSICSDRLHDTCSVSFTWWKNYLISWTYAFLIEQAKECFSSFAIWAFRYRRWLFQHFKTTCNDTLCKSDSKIW